MKPPKKTQRYKLMRKEDGHLEWPNKILWIEWDEHGRGRKAYDEPAVGRSLLCDPVMNGLSFAWLTTPIVEIVKQSPKRLLFKTRNSTYLLTDRQAGKLS
jgi:hypothetical protein